MILQITNRAYLQEIRKLKQAYANLPWYQRWWFTLWSFNLSSALSAINERNTTIEQIEELCEIAKSAWFFNSIIGLLDQFLNKTVNIPFLDEEQYTYNALLGEIKLIVWNFLSYKEQAKIAMVSQKNFSFFQSLPIHRFLLAIVENRTDDVVIMLKDNINLVAMKGCIRDSYGRKFFNISGFQHLLWSLNFSMWDSVISCFGPDEKFNLIKKVLEQQYKTMMSVVGKNFAIRYELNGINHKERHFSFHEFDDTLIRIDNKIESVEKKNKLFYLTPLLLILDKDESESLESIIAKVPANLRQYLIEPLNVMGFKLFKLLIAEYEYKLMEFYIPGFWNNSSFKKIEQSLCEELEFDDSNQTRLNI